MILRLLHNWVIVERIPVPQTTQGGIHLPLIAIELPQLGHIKFIGPKNPDNLVVGNLVMFRKFEGKRIQIEAAELWLLTIDDLLLTIKE